MKLMVEKLLLGFPELCAIVDEHIADHDEVFWHLLMADITREIIARETGHLEPIYGREPALTAARVPELLTYLDVVFQRGDEEDREVISQSLLENLPYSHELGHEILTRLPSSLHAELQKIR